MYFLFLCPGRLHGHTQDCVCLHQCSAPCQTGPSSCRASSSGLQQFHYHSTGNLILNHLNDSDATKVADSLHSLPLAGPLAAKDKTSISTSSTDNLCSLPIILPNTLQLYWYASLCSYFHTRSICKTGRHSCF